MTHLLKIILKNFQNHTKTVLDLAPGLNVIIGSSDHGKSSIIRGLYWLIFNRPSGTTFKKRGSKDDTGITVKKPKVSVSRIRGTKKNEYRVNNSIHKALGAEVPPEVQQELNLTAINIQSQFEPFFLLQDSPGQVAKRLNQVVGLDVIDEVMTKVRRIVDFEKSEMIRAESDLKKKDEELKAYADVPKLEKDIEWLCNHSTIYSGLIDDKELLLHYLQQLREIKEQLAFFKEVPQVEEDLANVDEYMLQLQSIADDINGLRFLMKRMRELETSIQNVQEVPKAEKVLNMASALANEYYECQNKINRLSNILTSLSEVDSKEQGVDKTIAALEVSLENAWKELDICPFCNQTIDPHLV